jgi:hypothetical protein
LSAVDCPANMVAPRLPVCHSLIARSPWRGNLRSCFRRVPAAAAWRCCIGSRGLSRTVSSPLADTTSGVPSRVVSRRTESLAENLMTGNPSRPSIHLRLLERLLSSPATVLQAAGQQSCALLNFLSRGLCRPSSCPRWPLARAGYSCSCAEDVSVPGEVLLARPA